MHYHILLFAIRYLPTVFLQLGDGMVGEKRSPDDSSSDSEWTRLLSNSHQLPWAAFILGHHSFTTRIWQNMFWSFPDPALDTHRMMTTIVGQVDNAIVQLAHVMRPAVLMEIRRTLNSIQQTSDLMTEAMGNPEHESFELFQSETAPGVEDAVKLRWLAENPLLDDCNLRCWVDLGRVVGGYLLFLDEMEVTDPIPDLKPLVEKAIAAQGFDGNEIPILKSLANVNQTLERRGPMVALQEALRSEIELPKYPEIDIDLTDPKQPRVVMTEATTDVLDVSGPMRLPHIKSAMFSISAAIQESLESAARPWDNSATSDKWYHDPTERRPPEFSFGPLDGQKKVPGKTAPPENRKTGSART